MNVSINKETMAKAKKDLTDSKRNTLVHSLAFRWLELNRPDVMKACRDERNKKYPPSSKSRTKIEVSGGLLEIK
jgi:hypothetical protein